MTRVVFVDALDAVRQWVNSSLTLAGAGNPLPKGAHLKHIVGARNQAYAFLSLASPGRLTGPPEAPMYAAVVSAQVYAATLEAAEAGARGYANALLALQGGPTVMGASGTVCLFCDERSITGPAYVPDGALDRFVVDATFYLRPA